MSAAQRQLNALKALLAHIRERLQVDLGIALWDGSTIPHDLPAGALALAIADRGAVAALIRRPKLDTLLNLFAAGRLELRNGTFFDLMAQRPRVRTKDFLKALDKKLVFAAAAQFLFTPRGGPWPLEDIGGDKASRGGTEAANRANIQYHYDLSNKFYALFLDPEMVYSCAHFVEPHDDLARAQRDKLDIICRKLRLKPDETLLDIGCGWGALPIHAARNYGARAHGVTLAESQYAYATEKIARLGLQDRVTIELKDYSRLDGSFDKVASIGMFEHVGNANYPSYFSTIQRLLKPEGLYLHHAIARPAKGSDREFFRNYSPEARAIGRYIFPGGDLDHVGMSVANLERHGFEVHDVEAWRMHYARTTRLWHDRLLANRAAAEREVGATKTRVWLIYLAGVSMGFDRARVGVFQTLASRRRRGAANLPLSRADLYR
ncbi:MAG TPA: cyclopropane-fatty-acyl-phospholipid synthase family protein [Xanthobacteraceae bacterium]|jgi:cyclopropane-fatty-acyl-phospholipid synthase